MEIQLKNLFTELLSFSDKISHWSVVSSWEDSPHGRAVELEQTGGPTGLSDRGLSRDYGLISQRPEEKALGPRRGLDLFLFWE